MTDVSSLILEVRPGESISIAGQCITIELIQKSGQVARLKVTAPRDMKISKDSRLRPKHGEMTT